MVRWEPNTRERLHTAALELYASRGFDETTVADIAASTGVTERTFFRHFADKREVIFGRQGDFQQSFIAGMSSAPERATPLELIVAAVAGAAASFPNERRESARLRQKVIWAHPELQERELLKMSSLGERLAAALRERDVAEPAATLAADYGVLVFRSAFARWLADESDRSFAQIEQDVFAELGAITRNP